MLQDSLQKSPPALAAGGIFDGRPVGLPGRRFRLSGDRDGNVIFLTSLPSSIRLSQDSRESWVTVTRTGTFKHEVYGEFSITPKMLDEMVRNFEAGTFGQDVVIDVGHNPDNGSAAVVKKLTVEGNRLRALVEWTDYGIEMVTRKGMRYLSADFADDWLDRETQKRHGPLLQSAALTNRPFVKRLDPVTLSEEFTPPGRRVAMHPTLRRQLSEHVETKMKTFLEKLRKRLEARKLSAGVIDQLAAAAEQAAKALGEDEDALKLLADKFDETAKQLSEDYGWIAREGNPKLSIDMSALLEGGAADAGKQLSEEQVAAIVAKQLTEAKKKADDETKKLAETLAGKRKLFSDAIEAAEGLDDDTKKELSEQVDDLITAEMSDDAVKKLAEFQLSQANKVEAARKLAELGYQDSRTGSPSITVDDLSTVKKLSECIRENLSKTSEARLGKLALPEKDDPFVERVLSHFDRLNMHALDQEHKILTGTVTTAQTTPPVSFVREVIRETLHDLVAMGLVRTNTDFTATATTQIPYEVRDKPSLANDGQVFEGQAIPSAGIEQLMDDAYVTPMKLALRLSNEVMHFTRTSAINWDAWGRNLESNARLMRELLSKRIANMLLRSSDSFGAVPVAAESIAAQLDGSNSIVKTEFFPIVRPFQVRNLRGEAVGAEKNAIAVDFDGPPVLPWDGTGNQTAGTYWRIASVNLGYIQFVDEAGDPVTPTEATATIGYSRVTNVAVFDLKHSGTTTDELREHLDGLLMKVGARKAIMDKERFTMPDYLLMSPVLEDIATNAKGFIPLQSRPGAAASEQTGELVRIKGIGSVTTNAPGVDLGDERILLGQRGNGGYTIIKPWMVGQPFEAVDGDGRPTGKKVVYGEEYNALHVPEPIAERATSVLVYDSDER